MHFVYSIQSEKDPNRFYIGITDDVERRLNEHNSGKSIHTNKFRPWRLESYHAFACHEKAKKFESYLKTGSGRAFCKKHFL